MGGISKVSKVTRVGQRFINKKEKRDRRIIEHQNKIQQIADRPNFTSANNADIAQLKNQQNWIDSFKMPEQQILESNKIIPYIKTVKKKSGKKNQPKSSNVIGEGFTEREMYGRSYTPTGYLDFGY